MHLGNACLIKRKLVPVLLRGDHFCLWQFLGVRRYLLRMREGTRSHKALPFDIYVMCIKFCLLI